MEQKRTLWILVSAGIFLCFVFGTAFIVSGATSKKNKSSVAKDSNAVWVAPFDGSSSASENTPLVSHGFTPRTDDSTEDKIASEAQDPIPSDVPALSTALDHPEEGVTTAFLSPEDSEKTSGTASSAVETKSAEDTKVASTTKPATTTFSLSESASTSVSNVTAQNKAAETAMKKTEEAHQAHSSQKSNVAKTLDESTQKKTPAKTAVAKSDTGVKKSSTAKSSSSAKSRNEGQTLPDRFWVQAASYSSKKKADEARALLDENKIQCEVFTYDASGTLYYRVRVGPYLNKDEAEYWKKQVDSIELFANAGTYIVNSSAPIAKK